MIEKFATYFSNGDESFNTKMMLTIKFLKNNGVEIKKTRVGEQLTLAALHQHGEIFSNLLIGLFTKLFLKHGKVQTINVKDGTFSISINTKQSL